MLTALELISAPRERVERELVGFYVERCAVCRADRPVHWFELCAQHAPVVRSIVDEDYLPSLRRYLEYLGRRIKMVEAAVIHREKIVACRRGEQTDQIRQRIVLLERLTPKAFAGVE